MDFQSPYISDDLCWIIPYPDKGGHMFLAIPTTVKQITLPCLSGVGGYAHGLLPSALGNAGVREESFIQVICSVGGPNPFNRPQGTCFACFFPLTFSGS